MSKGLTAPVMVGLMVGIAFIFIFSLALPISFLHGTFNSPPSSSSYHLIISGLKDTYKVGEKIDFQVTLRGTYCGYPTVIIFKRDLSQNQNNNTNAGKAGVVWIFNSTRVNAAMLCPLSSNPEAGSTTYRTDMGVFNMHWEKSPIIINQTGRYAVEASFYNNAKAEKEFAVIK